MILGSLSWIVFNVDLLVGNCVIFTDNSKIDTGVGCAFVVYLNQLEVFHNFYKLNPESSVFNAELLAIKLAVTYLIENYGGNGVIATDSRSVLEALAFYNSKIKEIIKLRLKLCTHVNIKLTWVKAHVGT